MRVRFLLGPAGSGKTFRCLAEIRAELLRAPDGPPLILVAPKQATFQLERQLLADAARPGYARLQIFSFERLARFALESLRVAPPSSLSEEGRVMVLRALLLKRAGELKRFGQSARRPGFAQQLSALLGELQSHGWSAAKLTALSRRQDLPPALQGKLHDLGLLAQAYGDWLAEHELQDANRLLDSATEALRSEVRGQKPEVRPPTSDLRLLASALWLDGFAEMTPQELDLLAAVLPFCERATLAFCLDSADVQENSWLSIWSLVGKSFQQCRLRVENLPGCAVTVETLARSVAMNRFTACPELGRLERDWTQPACLTQHATRNTPAESPIANRQSPLRLVTCPNPDAEATLAAREILKFVRGGGRFREAAVLVRTLDGYQKPLERAFRRYDLPFFLDRRQGVAHHPLAELTRSALRTVTFDWQHEDWFAALKAGFAAVAETDLDRLENEALARGWRGGKWRQPLSLAGDDSMADFVERLRQRLVRRLISWPRNWSRGAIARTARNWPKPCASFGRRLKLKNGSRHGRRTQFRVSVPRSGFGACDGVGADEHVAR